MCGSFDLVTPDVTTWVSMNPPTSTELPPHPHAPLAFLYCTGLSEKPYVPLDDAGMCHEEHAHVFACNFRTILFITRDTTQLNPDTLAEESLEGSDGEATEGGGTGGTSYQGWG